VINLKVIEERFDDGATIDLDSLAAARLIRDTQLPLKVLGEGELTKKFTVTATKFSASARKKIEAAGGTCTEAVRKPSKTKVEGESKKNESAEVSDSDSN
jgi:large subunit ribosomal protein L15